MKHTVLIKGITLVSFIALISLFLMYRTGKLNSYFFDEEPAMQTSPNGGKIATSTPNDSPRQLRLSSSKSIVMVENRLKGNVKGAQVRSQPANPNATYQERMSGSKSMVMIDNDPFIIEQKKRAYLSYMLTYRFTYFQDSLRRVSTPLPPSIQMMIDSMKFNYKSLNWYNPK